MHINNTVLHYGCAVGVVSFIDHDSKEVQAVKLIEKYFMKCQTGGRQHMIDDWRWHGQSLWSWQKFMGQYV